MNEKIPVTECKPRDKVRWLCLCGQLSQGHGVITLTADDIEVGALEPVCFVERAEEPS